MAVDMFLKIDQIKGESIDSAHKDEIDLIAWNWGMTQSGTTHLASGGGAGKVNVHDLTVTKWLDRATPLLMKYCSKGTHIPELTLTVRKAGDKPLEYVKIKMKDAIISAVNSGGSGNDDRLTETTTINFAKVEFEYSPQKADGAGEAAIPFTWNVPGNSES
jgi:type VI secretion system secreted protein Hcp